MLDLRSETRRRLLAFYFTNPDARQHVRGLAGQLGIDHSNLSKELRRLEQSGLFRSEVNGRQKFFELDADYPLLEEIRAIVMKTVGIAPAISQKLREIPGIEEAWLYGSFASGRQDAASDIDVLVIGSPDGERLAGSMRGLEKRMGREINYTVLTAAELKRRRARKDAFLENIWRHKKLPLVSGHG